MERSLTTEILIRKTVRFEAAKTGDGNEVVNVFVDSELNTTCIGWVTETKDSYWLEREIVVAAREFLRGKNNADISVGT